MMNIHRCSMAVVSMLLVWCSLGVVMGSDKAASDARCEPDPQLISAIDTQIRRAAQTGSQEAAQKSLAMSVEELQQLANDEGRLLIHILLYRSTVNEEPFATFTDSLTKLVLRHLTGSEAITAVAPYVYADDVRIQRGARDVMFRVCVGDPRIDFSPVAAAVAQGMDERLGNAVRLAFATSPGEALLAFARFDQPKRSPAENKPILWAEHIIADTLWKHEYGFLDRDKIEPQAAEQLDKLSRHDAWWARLYVAEIMRQHPAFRQVRIIRQLEQDQNRLVREVIAALSEHNDKEG